METCRMYFNLIFLLLMVEKSFQSTDENVKVKNCDCYSVCQKKFSPDYNAVGPTRQACERGCRFYSLVIHTSHDSDSTLDYTHVKEGCLISCTQSYIDPADMAACNFGCSSVHSGDSCNYMEHQLPKISYSFIVEESDVLFHPGDLDLDDVLIDPGLRKQFEKTLATILDSKPKLPEIHFRNLPVINEDTQSDHPRTTFKCPKFYVFDSKFELRYGKMTKSRLFFLFSALVFGMVCLFVKRQLDKQRKSWKQFLMSIVEGKSTIMKMKEATDPLLKDEKPEKMVIEGITDHPVEHSINPIENLDSKFEGITLVLYEDVDDDSQNDKKINCSNGTALPKV